MRVWTGSLVLLRRRCCKRTTIECERTHTACHKSFQVLLDCVINDNMNVHERRGNRFGARYVHWIRGD